MVSGSLKLAPTAILRHVNPSEGFPIGSRVAVPHGRQIQSRIMEWKDGVICAVPEDYYGLYLLLRTNSYGSKPKIRLYIARLRLNWHQTELRLVLNQSEKRDFTILILFDLTSSREKITCVCTPALKKTSIPFLFRSNGIWSRWQFSFRFWTTWNSILFKIERKTVTTIISHSM